MSSDGELTALAREDLERRLKVIFVVSKSELFFFLSFTAAVRFSSSRTVEASPSLFGVLNWLLRIEQVLIHILKFRFPLVILYPRRRKKINSGMPFLKLLP